MDFGLYGGIQLHVYAVIVYVLVTDRSTGRVGAPLTCNEVMLVDWKEGKQNQPVFFRFM